MHNESYNFVDVILPLPLQQLFTYSVPEELKGKLQPGQRVIVQFGPKKFYTAILHSFHNNKPELYEVKELASLVDESPVVNNLQLKFWNWISEYYMCSVGEVMKAALPSGMKLESETTLSFNPDFEAKGNLNQKEELLIHLLEDRHTMSIRELPAQLEQKTVIPMVKGLMEKGALFIDEKLRNNYKPKKETYLRLLPEYTSEEAINGLFTSLEKRAPKQLKVLLSYMNISKILNKELSREVKKSEITEIEEGLDGAITALVKKKIFETYKMEVSRIEAKALPKAEMKVLNEHQKNAYSRVKEEFEKKSTVLLHGVTGSGKTEIYIHLIDEQLKQGKQVLYLLPEIALTTQIITRLKSVFGDDVGVYHSKFSDSERVEVYQSLLKDIKDQRFKLILGVRSSVFLPFQDLGLIIVDEEHENTYKQYDPAPRYNARDAAVVLAGIHGAHILLGTATPAFETYQNALEGRFGLVNLTQRHANIQLPEIKIADVSDARRRKIMNGNFTPQLELLMEKALARKEQIILFQNRRGYSPYMECTTCGWVPQCKNCNVSLTFHKRSNSLVCHYCGYTHASVKKCGACGNPSMVYQGFGTEKIEDDVAKMFPEHKVARMDMDTTRGKNAYERLITDFETGRIDILIGTQMVSKGLDFDRVSLVGILNADNMLNFPDFRAWERSFQLMAQVSGRAGRKYKQGTVVVQTSDPKNMVIHSVIQNNYLNMFNRLMQEREQFMYPPYFRLTRLTLKHRRADVLLRAANLLAERLRKLFGRRILGPEAPPVDRIQNLYIKQILIKVERDKSSKRAKDLIWESIASVRAEEDYRYLQVMADVDPM